MNNTLQEKKDMAMNNQANSTKPQNATTKLLIAIIVCILILVIGKIGLKYFYSHDSNATVSSPLVFDKETKEFTINEVSFKVPSNIIVETGNSYLTMEDSNREFVIRIDIQDAYFAYLLEHIDTLKGNTNAAFNDKAAIQNYNGKDYITVNTANWFSKTLIAFTEASDSKLLVISVINKKNTFDYALLEKFSKIINDVWSNDNV